MRLFNFLLILLVFSACESDNKKSKTVQKKANVKLKKAKKQFPPLSDLSVKANLEKYLKEYPDEDTVKISTRLGDIVVRLYDDTPYHRANFLRLIKMGYYDETEFYRVLKNFIIQGGGTSNLRRKVKTGRYMVPAEIKYLHKTGALSMANPEDQPPHKGSSLGDFFIVLGEKFNTAELNAAGQQIGKKFSPLQYETYAKIGGAPNLDGDYTVFGEVIEGMDVVRVISQEKLLEGDTWPETSVYTKMSILDEQNPK